MLYTFQQAFITEPWISVRELLSLGKSCLYWHYSIVLLLSATVLSFCSCHVLLVETGRSNSCLNCSLTGRRCWENQTVTTLSLLHCTAFSPLLLLFALSLSLFFFPLTFFFSESLIRYAPTEVTGVRRSPLIWTKNTKSPWKRVSIHHDITLLSKPVKKSSYLSV